MGNIFAGTHPAGRFAAPGSPASFESIHEADPARKKSASSNICLFSGSRRVLRQLSLLPNFTFFVLRPSL